MKKNMKKSQWTGKKGTGKAGRRDVPKGDFSGKGKMAKDCDNDRNFNTKDLPAYNDISWYNNNPSLTVAAASISFPYRPGMTMPVVGSATTQPVIPGVMAMHWAPFVGIGGKSTDPINVAGREIFNRVRAAFSGSIDADSPDFIMYFMALDSIFSYIAYMKRIYRVCVTYDPNNYALPDTLMQALGFPVGSARAVRAERTKLWQYINELVMMSRKFTCPNVFPVFKRHYWLNDGVFSDAESINSQLYVFVMDKVLKFQMIEDSETKISAGGLVYEDVSISGQTSTVVDTMYQQGLGLIQALSNVDDTFIISGYLSRAFAGETFMVEELPFDQRLAVDYVPVVLMQIENSYTPFTKGAGSAFPTITLTNVTQDPSTNIVTTKFTVATPASFQNDQISPYLNIRSDAPAVADVVEASRLQTFFDFNNADTKQALIAGTEINLGAQLFGYNATGSVISVAQCFANASSAANALNQLAVMSAFDWSPFVFYVSSGSGFVYGDIHNMTVLSRDQAREINKICLYSEFNAFGING